jgi:hypothetical protein
VFSKVAEEGVERTESIIFLYWFYNKNYPKVVCICMYKKVEAGYNGEL